MEDRHQLSGSRIRQGSKHDGVEHGEDRRRRADPERQRDERDQREGRRPQQHSRREPHLAAQGVDRFGKSALAHGLLVDSHCEFAVGFRVPEPPRDFVFGFGALHSGGDELVDTLLDVKAELFTQRGVDARARERQHEGALEPWPSTVGARHRAAAGLAADTIIPTASVYRAHFDSSAVNCRRPSAVSR